MKLLNSTASIICSVHHDPWLYGLYGYCYVAQEGCLRCNKFFYVYVIKKYYGNKIVKLCCPYCKETIDVDYEIKL
jgi:hypothetical protein